MSKLLDVDFYNSLQTEEDVNAFHLLRARAFDAQAKIKKAETEAKAEAMQIAQAKAQVEEDLEKAEADKQKAYLEKYKADFLTENLLYAGEARIAAEAAGLRFSSYLETEVGQKGEIVAVKVKCVARKIQKKKKDK